MKDIPSIDRPREKLSRIGAQALTDTELLAVLLGSGSASLGVLKLAEKVLSTVNSAKGSPKLSELTNIHGLGTAKASCILAALEFSRRRMQSNGQCIKQSADILPLISYLGNHKQEHFICISLNGAAEVIATRVISVGLANLAPVHPREVFADPIVDRASAIIVAHNHPSGSLRPSKADLRITEQLKAAGSVLGIQVLDHIIFNLEGYYSFVEHGDW